MNTLNSQQERNLPPVDSRFPDPMITTTVPLRELFPHEKKLEAYLVKDLKSSNSKLAQLLGLEVNPQGVRPQQSHQGLLPDIILYPDGNHEPGTADASIEIYMETWDADHTNRSTLYTIELSTDILVVIAPEFPTQELERLKRFCSRIGCRLIVIQSRLLSTGDSHVLDLQVIQTTKAGVSSGRRVELLKTVQAICRSHGNHSITRVNVQPDGRLELNTKDARLILRANQADTTLRLYLTRGDELTAAQLFNKLLRDRTEIDAAVKWPIDWDAGQRLSIRIPYPNSINEMTSEELQETSREIAKAYTAFNKAIASYIKY